MDIRGVLSALHRGDDLANLLAALGYEPLFGTVAELGRGLAARVVGRAGDFPWYAVVGAPAERRARSLARRLARRGRVAGVLGLDPTARRLTVAVAFDCIPALTLELDHPAPGALASLSRIARQPGEGALATAARAADALSAESVGRRFFLEFRSTLDRMMAGLPGPLRREDRRHFALLQLTRVLFLYFVQAKGWLAGRQRFLAEEVDRCLARRRRIHRDLLRPLFFGTLNRPLGERGRAAAFGPIPFLNGGLFEPHPLERRSPAAIPNDLWRDAFDGLFERFHFTVSESMAGGVAPDMLGRVFEGVMAPDERRASGTYYTPARLVGRMLDAALACWAAGRLRCAEAEAERRLTSGDPELLGVLRGVTILDPAAGSGAFLVGALERLASLGGAEGAELAQRRRSILRANLFGVDRSATAVRLTELRLWLAVIADDPAERPEAVRPLPNLDCLVRQGDTLFDPVGAGLGPPSAESAARLAALRQRVVVATGADKRSLLRELADTEVRATAESLSAAERGVGERITECLREARSGDLFGERRGLDRQLRERLLALRKELRTLRQARRTLTREREVPWFHFQTHFADVFARGGFDLVVGNPPWLRAEEIPTQLRARLAGRYRWWRTGSGRFGHRPDLSVAFLERALELTAPGGTIAMLVPAKLAMASYGASARQALAASSTLVVVADLTGDRQAVFDATVYPLALVARRAAPYPAHRVRPWLDLGRSGVLRQGELEGGGPWILRGSREQRVLSSLSREHPALGERLACHLGVKTGANDLFLNPPELEPEVLRWGVRGRDVKPFLAMPVVRLLWSHGPGGVVLPRLPPRAQAHLAPHLERLRRRADYAGGPAWTLFRTVPAVAQHRVVWADLGRILTAVSLASPDDANLIPLNSCYVGVARSATEADRLTAWLNCTWVRAAARLVAVPAASGYVRFTAAVVASLPLPIPVLSDQRLPGLARAARRGESVQEELDELAAEHLGLAGPIRAALARTVALGADYRR